MISPKFRKFRFHNFHTFKNFFSPDCLKDRKIFRFFQILWFFTFLQFFAIFSFRTTSSFSCFSGEVPFWKNMQFFPILQAQIALLRKKRNFFGRNCKFWKSHFSTKHWIWYICVHENVTNFTKYFGGKSSFLSKFMQFPENSRFWQFCEISGNFLAKKKGGKIFENFRKFLEISGKNFRENFAEIFVRSCRCQKIFDKLSKNFLTFLKNFTKKFCEFLKIFSKKNQNNVFRWNEFFGKKSKTFFYKKNIFGKCSLPPKVELCT